jgi:hypothetical protein
MRWEGHIARMGDKRNAFRVMKSRKERDHCEDLDIDRRIILHWIVEK